MCYKVQRHMWEPLEAEEVMGFFQAGITGSCECLGS